MKRAMFLAAAGVVLVAGLSAHTAMAQQTGPQPAAKPGLATPPEGWTYLPELAIFGPAEIYQRTLARPGDPGPAVQMQVHTSNNAGILTRKVAVPLTAGTRLAWDWKVDRLPSKLPETAPQQHDYLSIAVKFENGRDLTYMWSAALPEGTHFECPLPGWTGREWHSVVRSGETDLGKWLAEERDVQADYAKVIGGKLPGRIVEVWLISNTLFQRGEGRAAYGDIVLKDGAAVTRVF